MSSSCALASGFWCIRPKLSGSTPPPLRQFAAHCPGRRGLSPSKATLDMGHPELATSSSPLNRLSRSHLPRERSWLFQACLWTTNGRVVPCPVVIPYLTGTAYRPCSVQLTASSKPRVRGHPCLHTDQYPEEVTSNEAVVVPGRSLPKRVGFWCHLCPSGGNCARWQERVGQDQPPSRPPRP